MRITKAIWLPRPEYLSRMNLDDPKSIDDHSILGRIDLDMTSQGWLQVGTAEVEYHIAALREKLTVDAVAALEKKLADADAEYQSQRKRFVDEIANLRALPAPTPEA